MEKIDIVIPLGNGSKNEDFELRFALRAIEKNFKELGKVILVGTCPKWARNVRHIEFSDPFIPKDANLIVKILRACWEGDLSERFLVSSDDQYLLKPSTFEELNHTFAEMPSTLKEHISKQHSNSWSRRHVKTVGTCEQLGLASIPFEAHIAYPVQKSHYVRRMLNVDFASGDGLTTHIYPAFCLADGVTTIKFDEDVVHRLKDVMQKKDEKRLAEVRWLNHNDAALLDDKLKCWLQEMFPESSKFESC